MQLPELPLEAWEQSKISLHLMFQIVGKIRLKSTPRKNHWWNVTLYVNSRGFTTDSIPCEKGTFELQFNFLSHHLEVNTSWGDQKLIPLKDGQTIADFYAQLKKNLAELSIEVSIVEKPYDMGVETPFAEITEYHHYQAEYVQRYWRIMVWVDQVFNEFSGRFYGKTCPVHLYWHHMDLAVTRFSGNKGPDMDPKSRLSDKDAYSHEVISFGFWAGDEQVRGAAFYSYTYPAPEGMDKEPLKPASAQWIDSNGSPMASLMYDDLRKEADPKAALLDFMETSYQAGAKLAKWDIEGLTVPSLEEM